MRIDHLGIEDECIKIYNPAKQELIGVYNSYVEASKRTGISQRVLRMAVRNKTRRFSPLLKIEIAARVAHIKKGN